MKLKQLLILVAVLAVLGLVAFIAGRSGGGDQPDAAALRGQDLLEGWDINDVTGVQVTSADGTVSLAKSESNIWQVKERKDFPADRAKVENMLRRVWATPVMQAFEAGESQNERMELVPPDGEGDDEKKATKLTFTGKGDSVIGHLFIGKSKAPNAAPGAAPNPGGGGKTSRYIRTSKDAGMVIEVPNGFDEEIASTGWPYAFGSIEADPGLFLNKEDFIKIQKVETVSVNYKEGDNESYALSRPSETGDFTLSGEIPLGKVLDASKVSGLKTVLSNASFDDLLTDEEIAELDESKLTEVTLKTFEGFTYNILIGPKDEEKTRYPIKFTVAGDFPTERTPEAGKEETEEEKTKADADFKTKLEENQAKLAQEKAMENQWFTLAGFRIDPLLKSRPDLLKDEETAEGEPPASLALPDGAGAGASAAPELPPGVQAIIPPKKTVEAVSEPVAVPPLTKGAVATTPPIEIPQIPKPATEEAAAPVKEAVAPVKEAVEEAAAPVKEAAAPVKEAVEEAAAPVKEAVEEAAAPVKEAVEEAAAPVKEAVESVQEAEAPAEDAAAGGE